MEKRGERGERENNHTDAKQRLWPQLIESSLCEIAAAQFYLGPLRLVLARTLFSLFSFFEGGFPDLFLT